MKTFDYAQANAAIAPLKAKFEDCAHGEGNACETLDKHLECCAKICIEFADAIREWAHDVFSGEVVFDPAAEAVWFNEAQQVFERAVRLWQAGRKAETPCFELAGQAMLQSALWELNWLIDKWVSPKLSVSPGARRKLKLSDEQRARISDQLRSLAPLVTGTSIG